MWTDRSNDTREYEWAINLALQDRKITYAEYSYEINRIQTISKGAQNNGVAESSDV